jgi:hypothetical protein
LQTSKTVKLDKGFSLSIYRVLDSKKISCLCEKYAWGVHANPSKCFLVVTDGKDEINNQCWSDKLFARDALLHSN